MFRRQTIGSVDKNRWINLAQLMPLQSKNKPFNNNLFCFFDWLLKKEEYFYLIDKVSIW